MIPSMAQGDIDQFLITIKVIFSSLLDINIFLRTRIDIAQPRHWVVKICIIICWTERGNLDLRIATETLYKVNDFSAYNFDAWT